MTISNVKQMAYLMDRPFCCVNVCRLVYSRKSTDLGKSLGNWTINYPLKLVTF